VSFVGLFFLSDLNGEKKERKKERKKKDLMLWHGVAFIWRTGRVDVVVVT